MSDRIFTGVFVEDEGWIVAWCEEVPGAITQGQTIEKARENLKEAIQLVLEVRRELDEEQAHGHPIRREEVLVAI